ncbi:MAG: hypothetical protein L0Y58_22715, partial [Verrucomicrobia subdivision 3 bacterium]|nr:hypothetical protein [Limisphaerales bacterium]
LWSIAHPRSATFESSDLYSLLFSVFIPNLRAGHEQLSLQSGAMIFNHHRDGGLDQPHVDIFKPILGEIEAIAEAVAAPYFAAEECLSAFIDSSGVDGNEASAAWMGIVPLSPRGVAWSDLDLKRNRQSCSGV